MIQCEGEERERRGSVDDSSGWIVLYTERWVGLKSFASFCSQIR